MATPYTVSRSASLSAPPERIRPLLSDFRAWPRWSPWEGLDPGMSRVYSGPEQGVGARYAWDGNRRAGRGALQVTRDEPLLVEMDLTFDRPVPSTARLEFVLTPMDGFTDVDWSMHGDLNTVMRLLSMVKSMDSIVGPDMEKGLDRLRVAAEADGSDEPPAPSGPRG